MNYPSRNYGQPSQIIDIDVSLNQQKQYYQQINNPSKPPPPKNNDIIQTLQIDSTYRDRNKFPLPSDFDIPMYYAASSSTAKEAKDPIANSYPVETNETFGSYIGPTNSIVLNSNSIPYKGVYNNYYLENDCNSFVGTHEYYKILAYNPTTFTVILPTPITPTNNYNIRKEPPLLRDILGVTAGVSTTEVVLGGAASNIDGIYTNCYLRIFSGIASQSYSIIISYTGSTKTAILRTPLNNIPVTGDGYEILPYTKDNFSPLLYNGTNTNQVVCYEIELMHLVLPNVYILNGSAGMLDDYPYFYVKLYNASSKPSAIRMITNNPNSREAIFSVPMDLNLTSQSYFTLSTTNPIQQMTFKPDDNLHFSVCLPNGEPLEFRENDWFSPSSPNPFLQISAVFSIKRVC
jgi:hypothetical protein